MDTPLLEILGVSKSFPGVKALIDVSFNVGEGEVVAVVGENGAGKSTLMKILAGVQEPDVGQLVIDGQLVRFRSVREAQDAGVALIHQELNLADNLDVAANLFLGREPKKALGRIDFKKLYADAKTLLARCGFALDPKARVSSLSIGRQQLIEIAKAVSTNARVIIMDEPTSSLPSDETERLFQVIDDLRARGITIIYISHRLGEVKRLADRVIGLRDGRFVGELSREQVSHDALVRLMVGRDLSQQYPHAPLEPGRVVLEVRNLRTPQNPRHGVSFSLRAGEIVGMAGLIGAGRSEVMTTLFGVTPAVDGTIEIDGKMLAPRRPADAIAAGIALAPEDRKQQGLILGMNVRHNNSLAVLDRGASWGVFSRRGEKDLARKTIADLRVKTPDDRQRVQFLSGGNQQKVVLGKWLATGPKVLLLDEPTRGIDVGAKREIYQLMDTLAKSGVAILFASSEMEEVLGMSDRVLVMHEGKLAGELSRERLSEQNVMRLATGANNSKEVGA